MIREQTGISEVTFRFWCIYTSVRFSDKQQKAHLAQGVNVFDVFNVFDMFEVFNVFDVFDVINVFDVFDVFNVFDVFDVFNVFDVFDVFNVTRWEKKN